MPRSFAVVLATLLLVVPTARADTLHVFAAGSLTDAFSDLLRRFPAGPDSVAPPEFGPSGLLRERIETGVQADILASADMDHARQLSLLGIPSALSSTSPATGSACWRATRSA